MIIVVLSCGQPDRRDVVLDVKSIVNKSPEEVESILGEPDSVYTIQMMGASIPCQLYMNRRVEVQYSGLRASDIIVHAWPGLSFSQTTLARFNLDYRMKHPADYRRDALIRWVDFDQFSAISFYNPKYDSLNNTMSFDIFFKVKNLAMD